MKPDEAILAQGNSEVRRWDRASGQAMRNHKKLWLIQRYKELALEALSEPGAENLLHGDWRQYGDGSKTGIDDLVPAE